MATNLVLIAGALLLAGVVFHPRLLHAPAWRATVTPLASIIGSGFLVAGPILAHSAGRQAWIAMLSLCGLGYLYGAVMRHNILCVEPALGELSRGPKTVERASDVALAVAYVISIAYYLNLFAAFGLRIWGVQDPTWTRVVATVAIATIGVIGFFGGLKALERVEVGAVGLKLAVIGGLLASLVLAYVLAVRHGSTTPAVDHPRGVAELQVLLGLLILVQGFETSRYLGKAHSAKRRVRTMRIAQLMATGIYVAFVFLATHLFDGRLPANGGETAIIDMLRPLGSAVAPLLIAAALASQSSAAVADLNGAGGLLAEVSGGRLGVTAGNAVTAAAAVAVTWSANIFEIITYASKAFVAYYALQSAQATLSAWRTGRRWRAALYATGLPIAAAILLFAAPAQV